MKIMNIKVNEHIIIGFGNSQKTFLYNFHYNYIKKKFKYRIVILYTDTDLLIYFIFDNGLDEPMKEGSNKNSIRIM